MYLSQLVLVPEELHGLPSCGPAGAQVLGEVDGESVARAAVEPPVRDVQVEVVEAAAEAAHVGGPAWSPLQAV